MCCTWCAGMEHPALLSERLVAGDLSWVSGDLGCTRTGLRREDALPPAGRAGIDAVDADRCEVVFAEAQQAVTPGQSVVVYESRVCLGGGVIMSAGN